MNSTSTIWNQSIGVLRGWKDALTNQFARHGLFRSRRHCIIGGVCGGLAERFDLPVSLVRFGFVLLALPGLIHAVLLYVVLAYLMPKSESPSPYSS